MAETMVSSCSSQCSLLLVRPKLGFRIRNSLSFGLRPVSNRRLELNSHRRDRAVVFGVSSDSEGPSVVDDEAAARDVEVQADSGGGGDVIGGGGGGGGGPGDGGDYIEDGEGGPEPDEEGKKIPMSMSQKLTLGFAFLVGVGGVMGFMKGGSQKSLLAGGISASILFYVYTLLPTNPTFASSLGLGVSAALLTVMGTRFKKSGKVFPAGVVSLVSLIMTGGYLHGIMRGMH